jgi:hypothetical protein
MISADITSPGAHIEQPGRYCLDSVSNRREQMPDALSIDAYAEEYHDDKEHHEHLF